MQAASEDNLPPDNLPFALPEGEHEADSLLLNIDGYEGPIDVLLEMARNQKVDLREISILQLARQYLDFIERAKDLRLDLAAEYLVMAAWLAYLKSRLLLPREKDESGEPSGEAMAEALSFQLRRLESMREAANKLMSRPQLGINIFAAGQPEGLRIAYNATYKDTLFDLLKAYGDIRRRAEAAVYELPVFNVMTMEEAVDRMSKMLGNLPKSGPFSVWTTLQSFMPDNITDPLLRRSSLASTFTAGLELAKQGKVEIRQDGLFRPIYLRTANRPPIEDEPTDDTNDVISSEAEGSGQISPLRVADGNAPVEMTDDVLEVGSDESTGYAKQMSDCVILTHDNKILLQQRPDEWGGQLTAFGGHLEEGESAEEGLVRELQEELGADVNQDDLVALGSVTENFTGHTELVNVYFWHDKSGTITGCYEGGEAREYETLEEALSHPKIMDYLVWALKKCREQDLLDVGMIGDD